MSTLQVRDAAGNVVYLDAEGAGTLLDPLRTLQTDAQTGPVKSAFFLRVKSAGSAEMNVNGSISPVIFSIAPPVGEQWRIHEAILHLVDAASMTTAKFGAQAALTNGVVPRLNINTVIVPLLDFTFKSNSDLSSVSGSFQHIQIGAGNEAINSKMTFTVSGQPLRLDGDNNEKFECVINDDLSAMSAFHLLLIGYKE